MRWPLPLSHVSKPSMSTEWSKCGPLTPHAEVNAVLSTMGEPASRKVPALAAARRWTAEVGGSRWGLAVLLTSHLLLVACSAAPRTQEPATTPVVAEQQEGAPAPVNQQLPAPVTCPAPAANAQQQSDRLRIATGPITGVYFAVGGGVCLTSRKMHPSEADSCRVEPTNGSLDNLSLLRRRRVDLGVVQSDLNYHAYNGTSRFRKQGADRSLRSVFSVYPEPFTVVATKASGIKSFDDLQGKRVDMGRRGSGERATMEALMSAKGWTRKSFKSVSALDDDQQTEAMCENAIDATIFSIGHPNTTVTWLTSNCDVILVDVVGPAVDKLIDEGPYYSKSVIPGGLYQDNPEDIQTFGVQATIMTYAQVPDNTVCEMVKNVVENLESFRSVHPAFASLDADDMATKGLSAPLHPGAAYYFQQAGLR